MTATKASKYVLLAQARELFYWGLVLMAIALPLSKFLTGLSLFVIAGSWLLDGNVKQKFKQFFKSRFGLLFASIFFLHLIGLLYSEDFTFAIKDLKIKLPLLLFPLFLSTGPALSKEKLKLLLHLFIAAVVVSSLVSIAVLFGYIRKEVTQARDISILISHIRFSLMICLAIFISLYYIADKNESLRNKIIFFIAVLWLVGFLFILESFTGIIIFLLISAILILSLIFRRGNKLNKLAVFILLLTGIIAVSWLIYSSYKKVTEALPIDLNHLETTTKRGHLYTHHPESKDMENGNYVHIYICREELDSVWALNSKMDINGLDKTKQPMRVTLIRFLASKGKRKDADGAASLSEKEFRAIENGIANVDFQSSFDPSNRIRQIFWEITTYRESGNPTGHSVTMRAEYVKTGWRIFKEHPLNGVGTGDLEQAFQKKYEEENSPISREWRLRAHNQYLTFAITFGCIGIVWFLISLLYPFILQCKKSNYFYLIFSLIAMLSMLNEDTLETQAGVTFFAFFNALFWFNSDNQSDTKP